MTRWQGMTSGIGLAPFAAPTARTAFGIPDRDRDVGIGERLAVADLRDDLVDRLLERRSRAGRDRSANSRRVAGGVLEQLVDRVVVMGARAARTLDDLRARGVGLLPAREAATVRVRQLDVDETFLTAHDAKGSDRSLEARGEEHFHGGESTRHVRGIRPEKFPESSPFSDLLAPHDTRSIASGIRRAASGAGLRAPSSEISRRFTIFCSDCRGMPSFSAAPLLLPASRIAANQHRPLERDRPIGSDPNPRSPRRSAPSSAIVGSRSRPRSSDRREPGAPRTCSERLSSPIVSSGPRQRRHPLDLVRELAHIARPVVGDEPIHRRVREALEARASCASPTASRK